MTDMFWKLTVSDISDLLQSGRCSPVEVADAFLERIEQIDPSLNAFITVTRDHALAQARRAEDEILRGEWRGPLHGIPFGLKDMINTAGIRTTAHSQLLATNVPSMDATVTRRLYDAGAVLMGKLATHEFAHGGPAFDLPWPPARNPWNRQHAPGGSSSGSAAAVAAGLVPMALGTDTGGSIRIPSWACGTVGFKPTFGRVSRAGVIPYSDSCDHVGPITWTVRDAALVLNALQGTDALDRTTRAAAPIDLHALEASIKGRRIGFIRHFSEHDVEVDHQLHAAVEEALQTFRHLGAVVEDVSVRPLQSYYPLRLMITESDLFSLHLKQFREDPSVYGRHLLGRCLPACLFRASDYVSAQRERRKVVIELQRVLQDYDVLVTAGAGPAPRITDHSGTGSHAWMGPSFAALVCAPASLAGIPALALCCGYSTQGLPLGIQVLGKAWDDERVLQVGRAYEAHTQWRESRPAVAAPVFGSQLGGAPHDVGMINATNVMEIDEDLRQVVDAAVRSAGLNLNDNLLQVVRQAAPHALELARSIPWKFDDSDVAATVFEAADTHCVESRP